MKTRVLIIIGAILLAALKPAAALDPLRIDSQITVVHMAEFVRVQNKYLAFAIQNGSDETLILELQRYPTRWPLASLFNIEVREIKPLRLLSSDGREFAGDWQNPNSVRFEIPPLSVRTYTFHGYPGPARHIWLWGDMARQKFERDVRYIWAFLVLSLGGLLGIAALRQALSGLGYGVLVLSEALALLTTVVLIKGATIHALLAPMAWTDNNLLVAMIFSGAIGLIGHIRFPARGHVLRGYWGLVRVIADLVLLTSLGAWGYALIVGPFLGYLTLDLLPLGLLLAGGLLALGVLLAPTLPAQMQSDEAQAVPPEGER